MKQQKFLDDNESYFSEIKVCNKIEWSNEAKRREAKRFEVESVNR